MSWGTCYAGSNNIHMGFPPLMSDGRNYSTWNPACDLNTKLRNKLGISNNYDYRQLANWNDIEPPYVIYLGNSICFKLNKEKSVKKIKSQPDKGEYLDKQQIKQNQAVQVDPNVGDNKSAEKLSSGKIKWFWPTRGKIVKSDSPTSKKGVDISGSLGK